MMLTTTDGGVDSGNGRGLSDHRGHRSFWKLQEFSNGVGSVARVSVHGACGATSCGVVLRVAGPPRINGEVHVERRVLAWRRHRLLGRFGRVRVEIGGARALVAAPSRIDRLAVQPMSMSCEGQGSERRRRGRLGCEVAVSVQQKVSGRCGLGRAVSSSLSVKGPGMASGAAQSSLSNYQLKLTVRGRPTPESRSCSRTAA
jgi:hypothetical protein